MPTDAAAPQQVEQVLFVGLAQPARDPTALKIPRKIIQPEKGYRASKEALAQLTTGNLTEKQRQQFWELVTEFADIFADSPDALGRTEVLQHSIKLTDDRPIRQRPYRHKGKIGEFVREEIQRMRKLGVVVPSESPYSSPVVVVTKKGGKLRLCVDYRRLNEVTQKDAYPLPLIDDLLHNISGAQYFSSLDAQSGYWQVPVAPEDRAKTAFVTYDGLFEFTVMPFGLTNAPATFQRLMNTVLHDLRWKCVVVYLDDVNIYSPTWEQHLLDLRATFVRFRMANLRLNIEKCHFVRPHVVFLGFLVSDKGIETDPEKIDKMINLRPPTNTKGVRSVLGLFSFYRGFVPNFSALAQPMTRLLRKGRPFIWANAQQQAFDALKKALVSTPVLVAPDMNKPFQLYTDASYEGLGALLCQRDDENRSRLIACASTSLNVHEQRYAPVYLECRAVIWAVRRFHQYLYDTDFELYTDQAALVFLLKKGTDGLLNRTMGRWIDELQTYRYTVRYRPGKLNPADYLSRVP